MTSVLLRSLRSCGTALLAAALAATALVAVGTPAGAQSPTFSDLDETIHDEAIRLVAEDGITQGYPDGTFRPRENVRRDQMATFLTEALRLTRQPADFPDVPRDSVHFEAIGAIAAADITRGFPDGTYRPRGVVTRGQMASFLAAAFDLPPGRARFDDVPADYVHADAIAALAAAGITEGYPDGTFRPNDAVKRDHMAAFLANAIPLPRPPENPCPGSAETSTARASSRQTTTADDGEPQRASSSAQSPATERDSEDLVASETGDVAAASSEGTAASADTGAAEPTEPSEDLGPAVPGTAFPLTSVLRTSAGTLEVHSQDLPESRGARVDEAGDVTATTTVPDGRRTWATAQVGSHVYVGQWGVASGAPNLYRYPTTGSGDRTATAVATVPSGNEFWALTADERGRLWAGTRAHADGEFRERIGLGNGRDDGRHVVHRIDPTSSHAVRNVTFCLPDPPTNDGGLRPDIKQLASAGPTLYVGTGQQSAGARLYAFEPGDRLDVPLEDVRDLTPASVRSASGVFALATDGTHVAFGTQASSGEDARLVVLDHADERVRVDVRLEGESRVDAVAVRDGRVVATGFSGAIYSASIPSTTTPRTTADRYEPPVNDQFHRYVEILDDGSLRGVTQHGVVWTRTDGGVVDRVNLVDTGAPVAPGLPHSLHVGASDIAVGSTSAVTLRPTAAPTDEPRTVNVAGEAKAITSSPFGTTYVASYPNAGLWRIPPGGDDAEQVRSWTAAFRRPADADHDERTGRVNVVARDDNDPRSETRPSPQANFQFRPSRLFSIDPDGDLGTVADGIPLGRSGSHTSPVPAEDAATTPVEASAVLAGDDLLGDEVYVGDTRGGVQRVDSSSGERTWYRAAATDDTFRRVIDIELVDGVLVVVSSGQLNRRADLGGGTYAPRTVIRELDPATGRVLARYHATTSGGADFAVGEALTTGSVTVLPSRTVNRYYDRATGEYSQTSHPRNDSFGGPYVDLDRSRCALYSFEREPSHLVRTPFDEGECAPEEPPVGLPEP